METTGLSGSPRVLRQLNRSHVLRAVREHGPATRSELVARTNQSRPTVNDVLFDLLEAGYLSERRSDGSDRPRRPGPRARVVAFRPEVGHVIGIDIGATKGLVFVADLAGRLLSRTRVDTGGLAGREQVLQRVRDGVGAALAEAQVQPDRVRVAVVGTPGVVDPTSGAVSLAPSLPDWEGIRLAAELALPLSCPVLVDNEVRLAVLGEQWMGAAQGVEDAVYVQLGVGVGIGILIGGRLYRGAVGAAGEIGALSLGAPVEAAREGAGAFEDATGADAFARLGSRAAATDRGGLLCELAGGDPSAVDAVVVFEAARRGDRTAAEIVDELVGLLAQGLAAVCLVLDPATVIVGGGLSQAGGMLLDPLRRKTAALVLFPPRWALAALGDEAVAYGAVRQGLQAVDEQLYAVAAEGV